MADPALKTSKLAYQILGEVKKISPKAGDVIVIEHKPIESRHAHILRRFQIRNHVADDIDEPVKWNAVEFEFNVLFKCRCVLNDVTGVSVFHDGG